MRNRFEFVALEQQRLARANLPLIDKKEMTEIEASWMEAQLVQILVDFVANLKDFFSTAQNGCFFHV